jgi:arylsulfatase A-like enzyme
LFAALLLNAAMSLRVIAATVQAPNIIVVVVDTLRADRVGVNGNRRGLIPFFDEPDLTPFFDELAQRGSAFVNAYATSSWTVPSVASLFTSRYPSQHHVNAFDRVLGDQEQTLAEQLSAAGYLSAGFSANFRLSVENGYAQGFTQWRALLSVFGQDKVRAAVLRDIVLQWLQSTNDGTKPVFLYFQFMEPHGPYKPPEPYRSRFARLPAGFDAQFANMKLMHILPGLPALSSTDIDALAKLYDGEVASVDAEIRALFGALEQRGLLRHAVIVITADHGEEFGEHGALQHGQTLFQAAIRVPLIIVAPAIDQVRVITDNVSLIDIAPTLLDLAGVALPASFEGRSLVPRMRAPAGVDDSCDILIEREATKAVGEDFSIHDRALISGTHKIVVTPDGEPIAFDLDKDPNEESPQSVKKDDGGWSAAMLQRLERQRAALQKRVIGTPKTIPLDDATKEQLRALGYQP